MEDPAVMKTLLTPQKRREGMAVKEWFRRLQPAPLYLMLAITALFFMTQLLMSHMTHALTLLVDAYHMLCNLIALAGCIITIKYGSASAEGEEEPGGDTSPPTLGCNKHESAGCSAHHNKHYQNEVTRHQHHHHHHSGSSSERRLKNTFGWARIDVLVMLIGCVFLTSLSFSLIVEALQTLIHIEHHDEMHHPIPVLVVGCIGLFINGICYLFIGGYTFHQASFLHVTPNGEVVLDHVMSQDSVRKGQRRLSAQTRRPPPPPQYTQRQGPREMCRDIIGCIYVIICALIVYFIDKEYAKYIDPVLSIVSALTLLILSYPYMRESGSILLQTIPDTIDIDSLRQELLKAFPDILNVHDLHVWRLTASRVFSTAHIIFLNNKDYSRITKEITDFFLNQGITQVTIQPEFFQAESGNGIVAIPNINDDQCLVPCLGDGCYILHCCANNGYKLSSVVVAPDSQKNKNEKNNEAPKAHPELQQTNIPKNNNILQEVKSKLKIKHEDKESRVTDTTKPKVAPKTMNTSSDNSNEHETTKGNCVLSDEAQSEIDESDSQNTIKEVLPIDSANKELVEVVSISRVDMTEVIINEHENESSSEKLENKSKIEFCGGQSNTKATGKEDDSPNGLTNVENQSNTDVKYTTNENIEVHISEKGESR